MSLIILYSINTSIFVVQYYRPDNLVENTKFESLKKKYIYI